MSGFTVLLASALRVLRPLDIPPITDAFWKRRTRVQGLFFPHSEVLLRFFMDRLIVFDETKFIGIIL